MPSQEAFSAHQKRLRADWHALVETPDQWTDLGPVGEGESQSRQVKNNTDGMEGVAKPGSPRAAADCCRAAHEKIAFDLACLVALPVPAVALWSDGLGAPYQRGRSISSRAFRQSEKWSVADAKKLLTPADKASVAAEISMMRVFHTWISDTDRKAEHIIVDLESPKGQPRIAFIDHGFSMSYVWTAATPNPAPTLVGQYIADVSEDREMMREAAAYIAGLRPADIEALVRRIPVPYLPDAEQGRIVQNLLGRQPILHTLIPP